MYKLWWWKQRYRFMSWLIRLRRQTWLVRLRQLLWFRVRLRSNKFHPSLQLDAERRVPMTPIERNAYDLELTRRHRLAHDLDLQNEDRARKHLVNT